MVNAKGSGSLTQSWLINKFALGNLNYWMAFIADSLSALFFSLWLIQRKPQYLGWVFLSLVGGYFLWTLTEYVFHRWVYHQNTGVFGEGHRIHHIEDKTLIAMPWAITTLTVFSLWYYFATVLQWPYFSGALAGWLAGFVFYSLVHHSHHHWVIKLPWFRKLKAYHRIHHHFPEYNYGVTLRFWDIVFGTRYKKLEVPRTKEKAVSESGTLVY
jgi:sterol desaturase/sphingolipid hydroxylase (fatty acid hydroxylase superfamily)